MEIKQVKQNHSYQHTGKPSVKETGLSVGRVSAVVSWSTDLGWQILQGGVCEHCCFLASPHRAGSGVCSNPRLIHSWELVVVGMQRSLLQVRKHCRPHNSATKDGSYQLRINGTQHPHLS